jgi:hypothetical protein
MNSELCINVWFYVDIETELCSNWSIKAYNLGGNDDSKTIVLKLLAESDYLTVSREVFPKTFKTVFDNVSIEGQIPITQIDNQFSINLDFFLENLENTLPPIFQFGSNLSERGLAKKQKFPENSLYVCTLLMENEFGDVKPFTSVENKNWYAKELMRLRNR